MSQPPIEPRDVVVTFLTPDDLEHRGIIFDVVAMVSTSDRRKPEATLRRKAAELGANVVLAYDRAYLRGLARGLAAQVPDVSSLVSSHRRLGAGILVGGVGLAAVALVATAHDYWGLDHDIRNALGYAGFWAGTGMAGYGIWLLVRGKL
jgi:hypothetical protein